MSAKRPASCAIASFRLQMENTLEQHLRSKLSLIVLIQFISITGALTFAWWTARDDTLFFMQMRVACEGSWMRKANNWRSCKSASPPLRRPPSADQRLPISKLPSFKPAIRGPEEEAASLKIRQNMIYVNRIEWRSKDGGYQSEIRDFFHALFGSSSFFSSDFVCVWSSWY